MSQAHSFPTRFHWVSPPIIGRIINEHRVFPPPVEPKIYHRTVNDLNTHFPVLSRAGERSVKNDEGIGVTLSLSAKEAEVDNKGPEIVRDLTVN